MYLSERFNLWLIYNMGGMFSSVKEEAENVGQGAATGITDAENQTEDRW